jgi:hypothetical protein
MIDGRAELDAIRTTANALQDIITDYEATVHMLADEIWPAPLLTPT